MIAPGLLDALTRLFVAPRGEAKPRAVAGVLAPSAVVCGPAAVPVGCALGLALRRRGPALVCVWGGNDRAPCVPATAAARRLATSLCGRGVDAVATGALVVADLAAEPGEAAAQAGRAAAAAGDAPVVLALAGPREPAFDRLLAAQDVAVLAIGDAPGELARLGLAALGERTRRAVAATSLNGPASWLARAGVVALPSARRSVAAAVEAGR